MTASSEQTFINGKVFTGHGESDFATAYTIRDGGSAWVGDTADVDTTSATDLQGRTVVPGLLDVHCHPTHVARIDSAVTCTVPMVTSVPEMIEVLGTHANAGKSEPDWIEGWGYDESKLAEHRAPPATTLTGSPRPSPSS